MAADRLFASPDDIQDSYWHKIDQVLARFVGLSTSQQRAFKKFSIIVKGVNQPSHFKNKP